MVNGLVNENMNLGGVPYDVANRVGSEYSTNFQENVKNKVEYFDVRIFFIRIQSHISSIKLKFILHIRAKNIYSLSLLTHILIHTLNLKLICTLTHNARTIGVRRSSNEIFAGVLDKKQSDRSSGRDRETF